MSIVLYIFGVLTAIAATVLAFIFILPEKKREKLPKFLKVVSDILNMKQLFLETIFRALYIFSTFTCVFVGFYMLFGFERYYYHGLFNSGHGVRWMGGYGLLIAILGPIVVRIVYEGIMMGILLVKNTIEINKKIKSQNGDIEDAKIGE